MANIFADAILYGKNAISLQRNISKSWLNNQLVFICVWMQSFCIKYTICLHFYVLHLQSYGFANYCKPCTKKYAWFSKYFAIQIRHKTNTIQENTESLQKICNPFQKFGFFQQNITKPM